MRFHYIPEMPGRFLWRTGVVSGVLAIIASSAPGCARDAPKDGAPAETGEPARERRFAEGEWTALWTLGGGEGDTTFLQPRLLVPASSGGLYVLDDGRRVILAFDAEGRRIWSVGKEGGGPDEFQMIRDIEVDAEGNLWVLDAGNSRLSVISPAGQFLCRTSLAEVGHAEQVTPLRDGRAVLMTPSAGDEPPFVVIDSLGRAGKRFGANWSEFTRVDPLVRYGYTVVSGSDDWAYVVVRGEGWVAFRSDSAVGTWVPYVERTPFPRVRQVRNGDEVTTEMEEYTPCSACSAAIVDSLLYVHFGGTSDDSRRLIDVYDLAGRRYRRTLRLPAAVSTVAASGDRVFTLQKDSATVITALRFSPE